MICVARSISANSVGFRRLERRGGRGIPRRRTSAIRGRHKRLVGDLRLLGDGLRPAGCDAARLGGCWDRPRRRKQEGWLRSRTREHAHYALLCYPLPYPVLDCIRAYRRADAQSFNGRALFLRTGAKDCQHLTRRGQRQLAIRRSRRLSCRTAAGRSCAGARASRDRTARSRAAPTATRPPNHPFRTAGCSERRAAPRAG
jgi:hypothetical protein